MRAPDPVAFSIFGLDVMWYGLLIGCGFLIATVICYYRAPRHQIQSDFILDLVIFMVPTAIIGARAYYVIFSWENYAGDWSKIFDTRSGGLAVHGGLIACFIVAYFVCRHHKVNFLNAADLVAPTIALAQSIGRWGNFFNEEAHGGPTDLPWGQIIDGVSYHPTFLYESIWCFLLFWFLLWLDGHHRRFDGQIVCLYGILYSVERFFVEGLRTDSLMIGPLRQAQVLSLTLIAALALAYYILQRRSGNASAVTAGSGEPASADPAYPAEPEESSAEPSEPSEPSDPADPLRGADSPSDPASPSEDGEKTEQTE